MFQNIFWISSSASAIIPQPHKNTVVSVPTTMIPALTYSNIPTASLAGLFFSSTQLNNLSYITLILSPQQEGVCSVRNFLFSQKTGRGAHLASHESPPSLPPFRLHALSGTTRWRAVAQLDRVPAYPSSFLQ